MKRRPGWSGARRKPPVAHRMAIPELTCTGRACSPGSRPLRGWCDEVRRDPVADCVRDATHSQRLRRHATEPARGSSLDSALRARASIDARVDDDASPPPSSGLQSRIRWRRPAARSRQTSAPARRPTTRRPFGEVQTNSRVRAVPRCESRSRAGSRRCCPAGRIEGLSRRSTSRIDLPFGTRDDELVVARQAVGVLGIADRRRSRRSR